MLTEITTFVFPQDEADELIAKARLAGVSRSDLVRHAVTWTTSEEAAGSGIPDLLSSLDRADSSCKALLLQAREQCALNGVFIRKALSTNQNLQTRIREVCREMADEMPGNAPVSIPENETEHTPAGLEPEEKLA